MASSFDGGQSARLGAANRRIEDNDVCVAASLEKSAVETVNARVAASCCAQKPFGWQIGQARAVGDRVEHAERYDTAARRCVGGDNEAIERVVLVGEVRAQESSAEIAGSAHLQGNLTLQDNASEVRIRHHRIAIAAVILGEGLRELTTRCGRNAFQSYPVD